MNNEIEQCALYLIQDTISGDYKIGISNNPRERKKEIRREYNVGELKGISITWFLTSSFEICSIIISDIFISFNFLFNLVF